MVTLAMAHAFTPQERGHYGGGDHAVVSADMTSGRLKRAAGDPLCKPARKFWHLVDSTRPIDREPITCQRCVAIATRLVLTGAARFERAEML